MGKISTETLQLIRNDGKIVFAEFYDNSDIVSVDYLDIKKLKFEGIKTRDIKKFQIHSEVLKGEEKIYLQNKRTKIVAGLSKRHLNKIISTVFTKDREGKYSYLKKEIVSNVELIFNSAIPILKHAELKKSLLYNTQIIHRFALPVKIGGLEFFVMITAKERTDFDNIQIDEFAIYDLYSEPCKNEKSPDSPSKASARINPVTFLSHYQVITYSMTDLVNFVKSNITKTKQ